jgi:hypothetical protein
MENDREEVMENEVPKDGSEVVREGKVQCAPL